MTDNDKKRAYEAVDDTPPLPAKRPLQQLSEDGPLTQQDVVYFKKEAIWRQMSYYKKQACELQRELARYEHRYLAFLAAHLLLETWYKLVVSVFQKDDASTLSIDLSLPREKLELMLAARRDTLMSLLQAPASATLEENLAKFADILTLKADKLKAEQLQIELKRKIADLQLQLDDALKENDRRESKSLLRISIHNHIKAEEPEPASNGQSTELDSHVNSTLDHAQQQELEDLKIEFARITAGYKSLEERLNQALSDKSRAEASAQELTQRIHDLDETDLNQSRHYLALLDQKNSLAEYAAQVTSINDELTNKLRVFDEKEGNFVRSISHELEEENHRLKDLLSKAECDLVRVRTARDELLGKQIVLKLEAENKTTNEELAKLNELLNERLKGLEAQKEKVYDNNSDASLEQLEKPELIKRLRILNEELKDIEQAFQSTRDVNLAKLREVVDREGLMKKLTIEKNKADQKYFASMRLKDLLVAENKVLKSQVAKSQELVTKLTEMEKTYVNKVDLLTKSVDGYRVIKQGSIQENAKLQETIKKFTKARELAGKEIHLLKAELTKAKMESKEAAANLGAQRTKESQLEAKLRATENLLVKYKHNNTSSILQEDEKQLEALRSITKCSVCSKNWKNTAITACGHVFCDDCVQERLAARLRRCPTCNKGFSSNDLLSIHL